MYTVERAKDFSPMNNVVSKKIGNPSWQARLDSNTFNKLSELINNSYVDSNSKNSDFIKDALEALNKVVTLENKVKELEQALSVKEAQINELKDNKEVVLTEDELNEVNSALELSGLSKEQIMKTGLLAECRKIIKQTENLKNKDINERSSESGKKTTIRGSASLRVEATVIAIKEYNNQQPEKASKYFISPSLVAKVSGSNRKAVDEYCDTHQDDISTHNSKHELKELDNRKNPTKFPSDALSLRKRFNLED